MVIPFPTANFDPTERASPYISAEEYQAQTGVKLSAENANSPPDQNKKKISAPNEGNEVAEKFIVRLSEVYLKPKNKPVFRKYVGFQRLDKDGAEYVLSPDKMVIWSRC